MKTFALLGGLALLVMLAMPTHVAAQATVATGSVQGTILDPNGASVPAAKVTITNKGTGQKITPAVTSAGEFNSGPIAPGDYVVRIEAAGFKAVRRRSPYRSARSVPVMLLWKSARRKRSSPWRPRQ